MLHTAFTIIELSGHLIDSLTLAKVIDHIQVANCQYQINDLQIGQRKNDISTAQISLWMEEEQALNNLLADLKTYGARPIENHPVKVAPCPADGMLPEGAYVRWSPPLEVLYDNAWIPVRRQGLDLAIVLDPQNHLARLKKVSDLQQGEWIVMGKTGIKVLPTLETVTHATTR